MGAALLLLLSTGLTCGPARAADMLLHPPPFSMAGNLTRQRNMSRDNWLYLERSVEEDIEYDERRLAELSCRQYLGEDVGEYIRRYEALLAQARLFQAEIRQRRPR
jgi:hypothetical protein